MSGTGSSPTAAGGGAYVPVACAVQDRLESLSMRGAEVEVVWHEGAEERRQRARITDLFARGGADWVALSTGETVRADRLASVAGEAVTGGAGPAPGTGA